jgi:hypothetical protein
MKILSGPVNMLQAGIQLGAAKLTSLFSVTLHGLTCVITTLALSARKNFKFIPNG